MTEPEMRRELAALLIRYKEKFGHGYLPSADRTRESLARILNSGRQEKEVLRDFMIFGTFSLWLYMMSRWDREMEFDPVKALFNDAPVVFDDNILQQMGNMMLTVPLSRR